MKNFCVIRMANKPNGDFAAPVQAFELETDAQKEYFRLCGLAVDSVNLMDSVMLTTAQGFELKHETFLHPAPEPEPEPEENA